MGRVVRRLDAILYPQYQNSWDNKLFREEILGTVDRSMTVLDLGAGAGVVAEMNFRGVVKKMCGVDPDPRVEQNPHLDEAKMGIGEAIPYPAETFDVVFADNVLEHLEQPVGVFQEIARVLKPGGRLLVKTPNRWHYVPLIATFTPHWFHELVSKLRGFAAEDTFPTRYRANSARALHRIARDAGLKVRRIKRIEGRPEYTRIAWPMYLCGWLYERAVNTLPGLSGFRVLLVAEFEKPVAAAVQQRKVA